MNKGLVAKANIKIDAPVTKIWDALVKPEIIEKYMFGADVTSDWKEGSNITWEGEMDGKPYKDKGVILKIEKEKMLEYTHFSSLSGAEDKPENYHTLHYDLSSDGKSTSVSLTQDNNENEKAKENSEKMWKAMLEGLKKTVEK